MNKGIKHYNNNGQYHGYQEAYWGSKLLYRGNYKNDKPFAYEESHYHKKTRFHIK